MVSFRPRSVYPGKCPLPNGWVAPQPVAARIRIFDRPSRGYLLYRLYYWGSFITRQDAKFTIYVKTMYSAAFHRKFRESSQFQAKSCLCLNKHHAAKTSVLWSLTSTQTYTNPLQKRLILKGLRKFESFVFIRVSIKFYPFQQMRLKSEKVTTEQGEE